jgi:hypothetical protein
MRSRRARAEPLARRSVSGGPRGSAAGHWTTRPVPDTLVVTRDGIIGTCRPGPKPFAHPPSDCPSEQAIRRRAGTRRDVGPPAEACGPPPRRPTLATSARRGSRPVPRRRPPRRPARCRANPSGRDDVARPSAGSGTTGRARVAADPVGPRRRGHRTGGDGTSSRRPPRRRSISTAAGPPGTERGRHHALHCDADGTRRSHPPLCQRAGRPGLDGRRAADLLGGRALRGPAPPDHPPGRPARRGSTRPGPRRPSNTPTSPSPPRGPSRRSSSPSVPPGRRPATRRHAEARAPPAAPPRADRSAPRPLGPRPPTCDCVTEHPGGNHP